MVVVEVVLCGDVGYGPVLVPEVSDAGGLALVGVEGLLVVPLFPVGSGAFDAMWLVIVTVASSVPSTRNNMTTNKHIVLRQCPTKF